MTGVPVFERPSEPKSLLPEPKTSFKCSLGTLVSGNKHRFFGEKITSIPFFPQSRQTNLLLKKVSRSSTATIRWHRRRIRSGRSSPRSRTTTSRPMEWADSSRARPKSLLPEPKTSFKCSLGTLVVHKINEVVHKNEKNVHMLWAEKLENLEIIGETFSSPP